MVYSAVVVSGCGFYQNLLQDMIGYYFHLLAGFVGDTSVLSQSFDGERNGSVDVTTLGENRRRLFQ